MSRAHDFKLRWGILSVSWFDCCCMEGTSMSKILTASSEQRLYLFLVWYIYGTTATSSNYVVSWWDRTDYKLPLHMPQTLVREWEVLHSWVGFFSRISHVRRWLLATVKSICLELHQLVFLVMSHEAKKIPQNLDFQLSDSPCLRL